MREMVFDAQFPRPAMAMSMREFMNKLIDQSPQSCYGTLMALVRPIECHDLYSVGEALVNLNKLDWHVMGFIRYTSTLGMKTGSRS